MMKKLIAITLAVLMVFGMAACANSGSSDGKTKVSVFWYDAKDIYLGTVRAALNKELEKLGFEYDTQDAAADQATQMEQIKTAISGGSNMLIVNVVTSGAEGTAKDILKLAGDIPVIFFNRAIGNDGKDEAVLNEFKNSCFIGTDAPEAGHLQGKMVGEYVVANYDTLDLNKDGKISYVMFKGQEGNAEAIFRTQYGVEDANKVLKENGKSELVYFDPEAKTNYQVDQNGQWSADAAKQYMETNLISFNEANNNMIELVICNNDGMAEGAIAALQAAGYNKKDSAHTIPVFGVDATDNAKKLISDGAMTGTVKQDAEGMASAIAQTAKNISEGKTPVEALAAVKGEIFSIAKSCASKLYVAYAPYTGK